MDTYRTPKDLSQRIVGVVRRRRGLQEMGGSENKQQQKGGRGGGKKEREDAKALLQMAPSRIAELQAGGDRVGGCAGT